MDTTSPPPGAASPPARLTRPQVEALRLMLDGSDHETAPSTRTRWRAPAYIGGRTAEALIARGLARRVFGDGWLTARVRITDAGRAAYAAEGRRA